MTKKDNKDEETANPILAIWADKIKSSLPIDTRKYVKTKIHLEFLEVVINTKITPIYIRIIPKTEKSALINDIELENKLPVADLSTKQDVSILISVLNAIHRFKFEHNK